MQPDERCREAAAQWMRYARSDLATAIGPLPDESLPGVNCFHAQQATEKAIKAVYAYRDRRHPRVHSIEVLFVSLDMEIPAEVREADRLSMYAVEVRYPDDIGDATRAEAEEAVRLARIVVEWAEKIIDVDTPDS